jgi:hypothetical protein
MLRHFVLWLALASAIIFAGSGKAFAQSRSASIDLSARDYGPGSGSFEYNPTTRQFAFSGSFFGYSGNGSSSYARINDNGITVRAFYLYTTYGILTVPAFSMGRSGTSYFGSFYSSLLGRTVSVVIQDSNDSDLDGIPDLSDGTYNAPLPVITRQPQSLSVALGGNAALSVIATSRVGDAFSYQWKKNGSDLQGENGFALSFSGVTQADAGQYSVNIRNDYGNVTSSAATLTVVVPPAFPVQATSGLRGNLATAFRYAPTVTGSAAIFTASSLPPGLTINRTTGVIAGTPSSAGYFSSTITASNIGGTATLPLTFTIPGSRLSIPFSDNFSASVANRYLPFNVYSAASMKVKNGVALFDSPADGENGATAGFVLNLPLPLSSSWDIAADVNLPNGWETTEAEIGLSLEPMFGPSDTVETHHTRGNYLSLNLNRDTEPSEERANNIRRNAYVGDVEQEELKEVLVNDSLVTARLRLVYLSGNKTLTAWVQTDPNSSWVRLGSPLDFNPGNASSLAQKWSLSSGSSLMLALTAYAEGGTGGRTISLDNLSITTPVAPVITSTSNLNGQVGTPFSYQISAANKPISYGASNLPAGLEVNTATGLISGTPTATGVISTVVLSATSPAGTGTRTSTAVILPAFTSASTVTGFVNDLGFTHPVTVGTHNFGANLKFSAAGLPTGMTINATSGVISGKPTVAGAFPATVTITANGASASQRVNFTIQGAAGGAFSLTLNPRPTNVLNLPAGLSYNKTTGVISGTPQVWGDFTATGQMSGGTMTSIDIPVMPSVPVIAGPINWNARVGQEARYQIVAGGFGREWAGWDDFNGSSPSTNWLSSGPLAAFRTNAATKSGVGNYQGRLSLTHGGTTNQVGSGYLVWARTIPVGARWVAMVESGIYTNLNLVRRTNNLGQATTGQWISTKLNLLRAGSEVAEGSRLTAEFDRSPEEGNILLARINGGDGELGKLSAPDNRAALAIRYDEFGTIHSEGFPDRFPEPPTWQTLHSLPVSNWGLTSSNQWRLAVGGFSEYFRIEEPGLVWWDNFVLLPDPGAINYTAYLVDSNGVALTNASGNRYLPEGLDLIDNTSGSISGIPSDNLVGGTYRIRVEAEYDEIYLPIKGLPPVKGGANLTLTLLPVFTGVNSATGFLNVAGFTHQVIVGTHSFGSNLKFSATGLPTGTTINATSGLISGKPTVAGTFGTRVTITAGTATAFQDIQISVYNGEGNRWAVGSPVSYQVNLGTGITGYQASGLPTGMAINATTGLISGKPTEVGEYSVTVTVPARGLSTVIPFFIRPIYVNAMASGANNGSSWANAYRGLQAAIDVAGAGSQIWVAAGTYKPTSYLDPKVTNDPRSRSFVLKGGVTVLGGFAGTETQLDQRDVESNPTVLSGDFNGNDSAAWPPDSSRNENAYHVIAAVNQTTLIVLDGLTVAAGNANNSTYRQPNNGSIIPAGAKPHELGGGGVILNTHFDLKNCEIQYNCAKEHGGMFVYNNTAPKVFNFRASDTSFVNNLATYGDGGALIVVATSTSATGQHMVASFKRCVFEGNQARVTADLDNDGYLDGGNGGAIIASNCLLNITSCAFINNSIDPNNLLGPKAGDPSYGLPSGSGGALSVIEGATARIENTIFSGNEAKWAGGAIDVEKWTTTRAGKVEIYFCTFYNNESRWGGAINNYQAQLSGFGDIFYNNRSIDGGGYVSDVNNSTSLSGSPSYSTLSLSLTTTGPIYNNTGTIMGGNPQFADTAQPAGADGMWFTADDGLKIGAGSPALGIVTSARPADFADLDEDGNTTELLPYDAAGVAYPSNPPYNAGAYQTVAP